MKKSRLYLLLAVAIGVVGALAVTVPLYLYRENIGGPEFSSNPSHWGLFGEYFGGVTGTFVSLSALIALLLNLHLQVGELERTRSSLDRQNFEGTYFKLLTDFSNVADKVDISDVGWSNHSGHKSFLTMFRDLRHRYGTKLVNLKHTPTDAQMTQVHYWEFYKKYAPELGPYFRTLYHLFKFVDDQSSLTDDEKIVYANIARARLSQNELLILFYNGTWGEGREFRTVIDRYGILKHVPRDRLLNPSHIENTEWYSVSAFQGATDRKIKSKYPSAVNSRSPYSEWESDPPNAQS
jgi:hypothetical protein